MRDKILYSAKCLDMDGLYKIGVSRHPDKRIKSFHAYKGMRWEMIGTYPRKGSFHEGSICTILQPFSVGSHREFFECDESIFINAIEMVVDSPMRRIMDYVFSLSKGNG